MAKWDIFLEYASNDMYKYPRPLNPNGIADPATCEVNTEYPPWGLSRYSAAKMEVLI